MKRQPRVNRWSGWVLVVLLVTLTACGSGTDGDPAPRVTATPEAVAWQRAGEPAGAATFAQVHLTGLLQRHQQTVNDVAFNGAVTRLATIAPDGITVIWNLANGESLFVQPVTDGRFVFFGPQDETLITVTNTGQATIYAIDNSPPRELVERRSFAGAAQPSGVVVQSPDRTLLAFGGMDGTITLWRLPEGEQVAVLRGHEGAIRYLSFAPDGDRLASIDVNEAGWVWSIPAGETVLPLNSRQTADPVQAVFSPDGQQIAVALVTGIHVIDLATGALVTRIDTARHAATGQLVYAPDGAILAACGQSSVVGMWRVADGSYLGGLQHQEAGCKRLAFSPDGHLLLSLPGQGRQFSLWDVQVMRENLPIDEKFPRLRTRDTLGLYPQTRFFDAHWSADGRFIALVDQLGPVYILTTGGDTPPAGTPG